MAAREEGLAWRIARLHPLVVFATLFLALVFLVYLDEIIFERRLTDSWLFMSLTGALWLVYPLFVILLVSGRFASRSPRRKKLPIAAFFAVQALPVLFAVLWLTSFTDADREFNSAERIGLWTCWLATALGLSYLLIGASVALVRAERGSVGSGFRVFGAFLLFGYGPFLCWLFLHRRVRRLVMHYGEAEPIAVDLPMEKLSIDKMASGHLCLELTERVDWNDFEVYASELLGRLDARVVDRATTVDMHLWKIEVETVPLRLVYEDFPNRIMLESDSVPGDMLLKRLQRQLLPHPS